MLQRMLEPFDTARGECVHTNAAANLLGLSPWTLRYWRRPQLEDGKLVPPRIPFLRMGRTVRYLVADINAYREKVRQS